MESAGTSCSGEQPRRNYTIGSCIGKGSFGEVHVAFDGRRGEAFAVKTAVSSVSALSLEKEIAVLRSLSHPHLVAFLGEGGGPGRRELYMEFVPGGNVAAMSARCGGLGEKVAGGYARSVALALRYIHDAGYVHGDVKGRNVLVGSVGPASTKLADFGAARRISDVSKDGLFVTGTPAWMAPEVARSEPATTASDVWSLGCLVIEMLTGKVPRSANSNPSDDGDIAMTMLRIGYGNYRPAFPAGASAVANDFLDKCLREKAEERPSCKELLQHPFLAVSIESADCDRKAFPSAGPSPRSILDLDGGSFINGDDTVGDEGNNDNNSISLISARRRIGELVANLVSDDIRWDGDDDGYLWETVRSADKKFSISFGSDQASGCGKHSRSQI